MVYEQRRPGGTTADQPVAAITGVAVDAADGRDETEAERADRNYGELLQELRVAQTGVQILFAFLLTLPFTEAFRRVDGGQRYLYLATMLATAAATACLLAPVSHHRILFRLGLKTELVETADRLARWGMAFLFLAVLGATSLIVDFVVGRTPALVVAAAETVLFVLLWYAQPMRLRARRSRR